MKLKLLFGGIGCDCEDDVGMERSEKGEEKRILIHTEVDNSLRTGTSFLAFSTGRIT